MDRTHSIECRFKISIDDLLKHSVREMSDPANALKGALRQAFAEKFEEFLNNEFDAKLQHFLALSNAAQHIAMPELPNVNSSFTMTLSIEQKK